MAVVLLALCIVTEKQYSCQTFVQNRRVAYSAQYIGRGACWRLFKRLSVPWAQNALWGRDISTLLPRKAQHRSDASSAGVHWWACFVHLQAAPLVPAHSPGQEQSMGR